MSLSNIATLKNKFLNNNNSLITIFVGIGIEKTKEFLSLLISFISLFRVMDSKSNALMTGLFFSK